MNKLIQYSFKNDVSETGLKLVSTLFIPLYSGIGSILMFHRVISDEDEFLCEELEIKASCLENTILYYRHKHYDFVSLDEAHERITHPQLNQRKFVAFTFDDGYINTLRIAYPILRKYEVPFTLYVTSSFPDRTADLWWYALKDLVNQSKRINFTFDGYVYDYFTEKQSEKDLTYYVIKNTIVNMDRDHIPLFLEALFKESGIDVKDYVKKLTLNWSQIKQLSQDKSVTIGTHTANHHNLRHLTTATLIKEVTESKCKIERVIEKDVFHFSYPFGSKNEACKREFEVLKGIGFKTCTTTRCANVFSNHHTHTNSLPRLNINNHLFSSHTSYYASGFIPALTNNFKRVVTD